MSYYIIKDHTPYTEPRSIAVKPLTHEERKRVKYYEEKEPIYWLIINDEPVTRVIECLGGSREDKVMVNMDEYVKVGVAFKTLAISKKEFPLKLKNFEYNGFSGHTLPGSPPYDGKFIKWTSDPGIVELLCSDGIVRIFPTYAIDLPFFSMVVPQSEPATVKTLFGSPAKS